MSIEDLDKVLTFEKGIESLRVVSSEHAKYANMRGRMKDLDRISEEISKSDIGSHYKEMMLEKCARCRKSMEEYSSCEKPSGGHALLSFVLGIVSGIVGIKIKDAYMDSRKRGLESVAEAVYERLREYDAKI